MYAYNISWSVCFIEGVHFWRYCCAVQVGEKLVCLVALRKGCFIEWVHFWRYCCTSWWKASLVALSKVCFTKQGLLACVEVLHSCSKPGGLAHTCTELSLFSVEGLILTPTIHPSLKIVIIWIIVTTFPCMCRLWKRQCHLKREWCLFLNWTNCTHLARDLQELKLGKIWLGFLVQPGGQCCCVCVLLVPLAVLCSLIQRSIPESGRRELLSPARHFSSALLRVWVSGGFYSPAVSVDLLHC